MLSRFIADCKKYMYYAYYSAKAELKAEVANSRLNWVWWVLEPFCFMLIYTLVFGVIFNHKEKYFPAFVFLGLTAWDFFNKNMHNSVKMIKNNKSIVSKIYLPKFILILSKMMVNGFKMTISCGLVVLMMIFYRVEISWRILCVIPILLTLFAVTFGFMTFLLHFGVFIEDLSNVVNIALRLIFYLTGVFYNVETRLVGKIPEFGIEAIRYGNPMALILSSLRRCLLYNETPEMVPLMIWLVLGIIISVLGIRMIYKNENSYVKVI
ncbi:MAG: ABC transporter permease [Clostridiales bacterium]|nr:ABC transporter permease [Clostridiales bacterium]